MYRTTIALGTLALAATLGCQGKVSEQQQSEAVSPDGKTAMQTRSQVRETPSGVKVKETEVRTREIISSPTTNPDVRQTDPAK